MKPSISPQGPLVALNDKTAVPSRFVAVFQRGDRRVTLVISVSEGRLRCESVTVAKERGSLSGRDLNLSLTKELLPEAIEAASSTLLAGDRAAAHAGVQEVDPITVGEGVVGSLMVAARIERDRDAYAAGAVRAVGRPKVFRTKQDLERLVRAYEDHGHSLNAVATEFSASRSTIHRAIQEARRLGLLSD